MRINIKCSSAVHLLLMVAVLQDAKQTTSGALAASIGSNPVEVRKLIGSLKKAGLIEVARGTGGTKLTKDPSEISLFDIYSAVEPKPLSELVGIHAHPAKECPFGKNIATILASPYAEIGKAVQQQMEGITLEQLRQQFCALAPNVGGCE